MTNEYYNFLHNNNNDWGSNNNNDHRWLEDNNNNNNNNDDNNNDDNNMDMMEWSCCNDEQTVFLLLYVAFVALAILTWNTLLSKPIRLIAVFIHEWCHAVACWLTCGDVRGIQVWENERILMNVGGVSTAHHQNIVLLILVAATQSRWWHSGDRIV